MALNYQKVAELINFAALIAFMGVNLATIKKLYFDAAAQKRNVLTDLIVPAGNDSSRFIKHHSGLPDRFSGDVCPDV